MWGWREVGRVGEEHDDVDDISIVMISFIYNYGIVFLLSVSTFIPAPQLNAWHIIYENLSPAACTAT